MDYPLKLHTEFVMDVAHFLPGYDGNCSRLHGHSVRVRIWVKGFSSDLDNLGILYDFNEAKKIRDKFDHKSLNEILVVNPTAENIALTIYKELKIDSMLGFCVRVYESSIGKETWVQTGDWDE